MYSFIEFTQDTRRRFPVVSVPSPKQTSSPTILQQLPVFCSFLSLSHLWRARFLRSDQEWPPPYPSLIWPCLALFTPTAEAEMRPAWPRLALRSLVCAGPAWPRCGLGWPWLRIRGQGWEWPGAAKLLIRFHFLPFRPIPYRLRGEGMRGSRLHGNDGGNRCYTQTGSQSPAWNGPQECAGVAKLLISAHFLLFPLIPLVDAGGGRLGLRLGLHPHPHLLPSREKGSRGGTGMRGSRFRGNDGAIRVNDACEQCSNRRGDGAMGSCRR